MQSETLKLHNLAHNEFLSDVIISFKADIEMEKVKAHKLILGCASSKFFEMLKAHPEEKELSIELDHGFSKQIVDKVLELAYLQVGEGDMRVEQEINMLPTARDSQFSEYISLSAFFGFTKVQTILSKKILQQSSNIPSTALNLLQTAINTNPDKQLFGQALQTLAPHFQQCLMNTNNISQLQQLPFNTFKQIIDCDQLDLRDETDILHLVYQYILYRETQEEQEEICKESEPSKAQKGEEKKDSGNQDTNLETNSKEPEKNKQELQIQQKNTNEQQGQELKGDAVPAQNINADSNNNPTASANANPTEQNLPKVEEVQQQKVETQLLSELIPKQNQPEGEEKKPQSAQKQATLEKNQEQDNKKIETNSKNNNTKDLASVPHKLTREQKASLLLSVRLGQVSHESLLKYSDIDILREFKELFLQALSFKLSALQPSQSDFIPLYQFNPKPRISQNGSSSNNNSNQMDILSNRLHQGTNNIKNSPVMQQLEPDLFSQGITNRSEFKQNLNKMSSNNNPNEFNQTILQEIHNDLQGNDSNKNNNNPDQIQMNNLQGLAQGIAQQFMKNNNAEAVNSYVAENMPSLQSFMANLGVFQQSLQQQSKQGQQGSSQQQQQFQQGNTTEKQQQQQQQGQLRAPQSLQDQQSSPRKKNSLLSSGLRAPQALLIKSLSDFSMGGSALVSPNNRSANNNNLIPLNSKQQPISGIIMTFTYSYDMDENGALFYLGTYGKKRNYMNPQSINLAVAFASSVRTGNIQSFIGREPTNLSTCNERMSFMGVDLGKDRMLRPSAYSIRNRNATTYCVLNWKIEGSVDGTHFIPFDERIHYDANDEQLNQQQQKQRELLQERGGITSYGVDEKIVARLLEDNGILGFRYFRIVQIGANTHNSDNLSLSGFELYGAAIGRGWILENSNN